MEIDLILPYVNPTREKWQELYMDTCLKQGRMISEDERYRELFPLKYLLRAIDKNASFIRTLYLVVQERDQVPEYVKESENLKIIEHKDIIPEELLPTYNSGTIEMYVYKIPNLSEHFIYINDDMYPIKKLWATDFFDGNKPRINIIAKRDAPTVYRHMLKSSENLINLYLCRSCSKPDVFLRDGHSWTPMIKSHWEILHKNAGDIIKKRCSTFREAKNIVQQVVTYYEYFTSNLSPRLINLGYCELSKDIEIIKSKFNCDILCVNDVRTAKEDNIPLIKSFLKDLFPEKSKKYEK